MKKLLFLIIIIAVIFTYQGDQFIVDHIQKFDFKGLQDKLMMYIEFVKTPQGNALDNERKELPIVDEEKQPALDSVSIKPEEESAEGIDSYQEKTEGRLEPNTETAHVDTGEIIDLIKQNTDKITMNEKYAIIRVALRNFSMKEIYDWKKRFSDGIAENEKEQFVNIVYDRLSEEDITTLKEIVVKYLPSLTAKINTIEKAYSSR